jgi:hypothetical protein
MAFLRFSAAPLFVMLAGHALAGPFAPAAGLPGSDAVPANDARFTLWATAAEIIRGPANIASANPVLTSFGDASDALGPADATPDSPYTVVSLGDGGSATLTFAAPFGDVPGPDFAVFENGFSTGFLELAHVEVSSDGVNFFRFPSTSLTVPSATPGLGGSVDPTNVRNLAGKYVAGFGTPFDLAELRNVSPDLDVQRITHVRVIDVVGTNNPALGSFDSTGNIVIDPYPTNFPTGGFDLDAVGVFSATTTTYAAWTAARGLANNDALPTADPDRNGVPNFVEYLTGDGTLKIADLPPFGQHTTLSFNRLSYRTGGNLRVEESSDLIHWSAIADSVNGGPLTPVDESHTRIRESGETLIQTSLTIPLSATPKFYRLAAGPAPAP